MRATCEFSEKKGVSELPNIMVRIFKTKDDITIKISDLGGGINRSSSSKIFNYMYSTAPKVSFKTYKPANGLGTPSHVLMRFVAPWKL